MRYPEQLQAVVDTVGEQLILECLLGEHIEKVAVAAQLSKDSDGRLTQKDKDLISSL